MAIITKRSILEFAAVLDTRLLIMVFFSIDLISNVLSSFIQEDMHKMKERALQWNEAFRPNII